LPAKRNRLSEDGPAGICDDRGDGAGADLFSGDFDAERLVTTSGVYFREAFVAAKGDSASAIFDDLITLTGLGVRTLLAAAPAPAVGLIVVRWGKLAGGLGVSRLILVEPGGGNA